MAAAPPRFLLRPPSPRAAWTGATMLRPFRSIERRHGSKIGDDILDVSILDAGIEAKGHRRLQRVAVARDALPDRAGNLGVAPGTDAGYGMRGDVGGDAGRAVGHALAK